MTIARSNPEGQSAAGPTQFLLVLGLDTFGDVTYDQGDKPLSHAQTIRDIVEQGVLADQVGVDFFGIGEHHTDDFPLSPGTWSWRRSRPAQPASALGRP